MGIQILPQEGSLASNVGSGIGRGLAEQIPEEIKRYRLAQGLKDLGLKSQQGATPYETVSSLAAIPGIDPGLMGVLAPLLQQQAARSESLGQAIPQGAQPSKRVSEQPQGTSAPSPRGQEIGARREMREGYLQEPTPQEIAARTQMLMKERPYSFPTEDVARARAVQDLGQEVAADKSYQQRLDLVNNEFEKSAQSFLQKDKSLQEGEIGGKAREQLLQQALDEMSTSNKSPRTIGQEYAKKLYEVAKAKASMREIGEHYFPGEKEVTSLRDLQNVYKKYGIDQRVYIEDLMTAENIPLGAASYIANPLKDTDAGKLLYSLPPNRGIEAIKRQFTNQEAVLAKKLAPLITENDLMGSIAYIAQQRGYNGNKLLGELQKLLPADKVSLQQSLDMNANPIQKKSLHEGWLMGWSGENAKARR